MSLRKSKVSIGLPVYNGEKYVGEAIESFLAQTMGDFELVISDNGSTDATEQLCRRFAEQDGRIRYFRSPQNIGANANFNRVVHLSTAKYFKWAAADDCCTPQYLESCVQRLEKDPTAALCHTQTTLIDPRGRAVSPDEPPRSLAYAAPIDPPRRLDALSPIARFRNVLLRTRWCFEIFGVVRREQLLSTGLQGSYYGSDKVVLAVLSLMGPFHEVPEKLFLRRCHPLQSTSIISARARAVWSDPRNSKPVILPQWACLRGYARGLRSAALFPWERAACELVLARYVLQLRKMTYMAETALSGMHIRKSASYEKPRPRGIAH
jgi:hypothetical protein